jgi:sortase A
VGDLISITRDDNLVFTYRVTGTSIADWNKSGIDRHASGFNLVLSTCYPSHILTLRYHVHAERCGFVDVFSQQEESPSCDAKLSRMG